MKYSAIIFDLDGTLLNSKKDIAVATNATLEKMNCPPILDDVIYTFVGKGVRDLIKGALCNHDEKQIDEALAFFNDYYLAHCCDHSRMFDGVDAALEEFKSRGVKMSVFTNKPQNFTDKILSQLDYTRYFDIIIGAENGYPHKPDKTGTQAILRHLGATQQQTLMVGDSIIDLQTAENGGIDCALMLYGFSPREEMMALSDRSTYLLEEFGELLSL
jgi:phosphoglycolate phosphatase